MNKPVISRAEQIFYPGWLMVSQLRCGQPVEDGKALYRRACQLVKQAREELAEAGFSQENSEIMLYAFCALLDESVLNREKQTMAGTPGSRTRCRLIFLVRSMPEKSSGSVFVSN